MSGPMWKDAEVYVNSQISAKKSESSSRRDADADEVQDSSLCRWSESSGFTALIVPRLTPRKRMSSRHGFGVSENGRRNGKLGLCHDGSFVNHVSYHDLHACQFAAH